MIDTRILAEDPERVKADIRKRHADASMLDDVDTIAELSEQRRALVAQRDDLRATRNRLSKEIGGLYKQGKRDEAEEAKATVQAGNVQISDLEEQLSTLDAQIAERAMRLPNLLHSSVPEGAGEEDNPLVRSWGTPPDLDFEPQAHVEVGTDLGILDLDRATKITGARFSILTGDGARLERALINFFLDTHTDKHGYTEAMVPYIVHRSVAEGTGQLPKFEADMFRLAEPLNGQDAFLIPTAELPVTNIHRGEILDASQLPIKYVAFTPCFRSEAGAAGRDTRGIIRQHQFHKVEMVWVTTPDQSEANHEALVGHAEALLQALELPYRVVLHCGGEVSFSAARCYDIEVWLPSQKTYREISSCSLFTDFQARRMSLRYRPESVDGKKQKPRLCHTLNGSGLAVGRTWVAIIENNQQADGSVVIPEVLRPYMGGKDVIQP